MEHLASQTSKFVSIINKICTYCALVTDNITCGEVMALPVNSVSPCVLYEYLVRLSVHTLHITADTALSFSCKYNLFQCTLTHL